MIGSHERRPWEFAGVETVVDHLDTGDYSVRGLESYMAIVRRTPEDLVATLVERREDFHAELRRMACMVLRAVIVESDLGQLLSGDLGGVDPEELVGWVVSIITDFRVPVYMLGPSSVAAPFALGLMRRSARYLSGRIRERSLSPVNQLSRIPDVFKGEEPF